MADEDACFSCGNNERPDLPPRERIYAGPGWTVAHAFRTALPGWLVLLPRRHVTALDELTAAEAEERGPLLQAVTGALREATCCDKTYMALFAEAEGYKTSVRSCWRASASPPNRVFNSHRCHRSKLSAMTGHCASRGAGPDISWTRRAGPRGFGAQGRGASEPAAFVG